MTERKAASKDVSRATKRVRLVDVAQAAGVAVSTVSRVFSDPGRINFQTAEHVLAVAEELGYRRKPAVSPSSKSVPSQAPVPARVPAPVSVPSPVSPVSPVGPVGPVGPVNPVEGGIIALVVKDTADGISSQILKGAQVTAMEADSAVSVIETGTSAQRTTQMLDHLVGKVDGVILATDAPGTDFIRDYARRMPLVVLNRPVEGVASVIPDPRIGVVRALSLFKRYHHTSVTYVAGPSASWANQSRWRYLHDIGQRMGFKVNQIGPVHATVEGGYQAALALEGGRATAIVTYNDLIAAGIVLRLGADGVKVPDDVSVIGFDNTLIAPVVTPPITTIRIPRAQLGQVAVRRLLGRDPGSYRNPADAQVMERLAEYGIRCEDEESPDITLVDTSIIVRRSVGERRRAQ